MEKFREMRRKEKAASKEEAIEILSNAEYMTLSTKLENSYPFNVPLNHVYAEGKIYFHSALEGQKVDAFKADNKVCISVVEQSETVPEKFSVNFRSVVVFGRVYPVTDNREKYTALFGIVKKFSPGFEAAGKEYIDRRFEKTAVYAVEIDHISCKISKK